MIIETKELSLSWITTCWFLLHVPNESTTHYYGKVIQLKFFIFYFWKGSNSILWNYQLLSFNLAEKLPKLIFGEDGVGYGGKLSINFRIPDHNFLIQKRKEKKKKKSNFSLAISPSCLLAKNVNLDHDIQLSFLSRSLAENCKKIRKPFILLIIKYYFMTLQLNFNWPYDL